MSVAAVLAWPDDSGVAGGAIVGALAGIPAYIHSHVRLARARAAERAQRARHHVEQMAQAAAQHNERMHQAEKHHRQVLDQAAGR